MERAGYVASLSNSSGTVTRKSDANGEVSVILNSGTVPTPVRVRATLSGSTVTTVSNNMTVAVGLPSQVNFSLAQNSCNIEGFNLQGTTNTYTIVASDRQGNPVPDGTTINFISEGGQIVDSQVTAQVSGIAKATSNFVSASPIPADGRITVNAYALGEESFIDQNGNNVYDLGEPFQDLGDIYKDRNFNGIFNSGTDEYISLDLGGTSTCATIADPLLSLDKTIPSRPATCDAVWGRAYVRRAIETVMSKSTASPVWDPQKIAGDTPIQTGPETTDVTFYKAINGTSLSTQPDHGVFTFILKDSNTTRFNPMPQGTTVGVTATKGLTVRVNAGSPVANSCDPTYVAIYYEFDSSTTAGTVTITFTTPNGTQSAVDVDISQ